MINSMVGRMTYKVNQGKFTRVNRKFIKYLKRELPDKTLKEFKQNTPIDQGNARRNTKKSKISKGFKITADYPYSGVIEEGQYPNPPKVPTGRTVGGFSTQAPKGITEPTIDWLQSEIREKLRKLNRGRF